MVEIIPPKRIALSGGGMKGIAHIGALEVLEERGLLKCVKEYIGTSVGALISFCICIGYTLKEIRSIAFELDFSLTQNFDLDNVMLCIERFGIEDGANVDKLFTVLLKAKHISPTITFEEFGEQFPDAPLLRVYAVEIHSAMIHEFSRKKTPRAEIKMAIRASTAIPVYFPPICDISSNNLYVDGGLIAHFPFHHLTAEERSETLGIAFDKGAKSIPLSSMTWLEYMTKIYHSIYNHQNAVLYKQWSHRIIVLKSTELAGLNFGAGVLEKTALANIGRDGVVAFLSRGAGTQGIRRNSI